MTKFGQAEYSDFMARVFADKLDEILEAADKQNFNSGMPVSCRNSLDR